MKTLITAAMLLALTVPAQASKFRESDRKWLPTIDKWLDMYWPCMKGHEDEAFRDNACKIMYAAQKKLIANGYCVMRTAVLAAPAKTGSIATKLIFRRLNICCPLNKVDSWWMVPMRRATA